MDAIRDKHSKFIMEIETQSKLQTNETYKYKYKYAEHFHRVFLAFK